ncbi:hypothetical protein L218DRAFT_84425 [Marasmius fiardii PR-910]|nr:hypothetical protein L218DRAFT_84425 [Marasmius fiardii PR-910]
MHKVETVQVVATVEPTLSAQDVEGAEEAYDETADNVQDHASDTEADNSNQHNAEHPELTTENDHLEPLPGDPDISGDVETSEVHDPNDPGDVDGTNSDENYTEHGNDDESYAENTDEWDDDTFDDDGGLNTTFEEGAEEEPVAGESSNTLSMSLLPSSPGSKRPRVD